MSALGMGVPMQSPGPKQGVRDTGGERTGGKHTPNERDTLRLAIKDGNHPLGGPST